MNKKILLYLFILSISLITISASFAADNTTVADDTLQTASSDTVEETDSIITDNDSSINNKEDNNLNDTKEISQINQKNIKQAQASTGIAFSKSYRNAPQTVSITATLKSGGVPIANQILTISFNNDTQRFTTDSNGSVTQLYYVNNPGIQIITMEYAGNDEYKACNRTETFYRVPSNSNIKITLNNTKPSVGDVVNITARLEERNGTAIVNKPLVLVLNNKTYNDVTDNLGCVYFLYNVTTAMLNNFTVIHEEDAWYEYSMNYKLFNTTLAKNTITITLSNTSFVEANVTIAARLVDVNQNPIANESLTVRINNKVYTKKTDNDGYVYVEYNTTKAGQNNLTVEHNASKSYAASNKTRNFTTFKWGTSDLIWKKYDTGSYTIDTRITLFSNHLKVSGEKFRLALNDNMTTVTTDEEGVAHVLFHLQDRGDQTLYIYFDETYKYLPHSRNVTISSYKYNTTVNTIVNNTATLGNTLPITAQLNYTSSDGNSLKLSNEPITISINNINYTGTTDSKGQYTLNYTPTTTGILNIKSIYNQGQYKFNISQSTIQKVNVTGNSNVSMQLLTGSFNAKPGETVKLIAHINDNGVDVNGGQLVFKLNGVTLKDDKNNPIKVNIKNGLAVLEYRIPDTLSARTHNLTAVYASTLYGRVEMSTPMTIYKYETHIDVNPLYATNNNIVIKAQVVDQNNQALNKQTPVCIKVNGKSYNLNTTTGTINYKISQSLKDGYYNITIISGENGKYLGATATTVLVKSNTTIKTNYINNTLNTKNSTSSGDTKTGNIMSILTGSSMVKPGDTLKLIAHIVEDGLDVTGGQLVFKLNGLTLKDDNSNPIKVNVRDGLAILEYKIPDTLSAKTHNLTAVYSSAKYGRVELTTSLTMNRLNTHIAVNSTYTSSNTNYIKAKILDDNNQLINKKTAVVIKIDGKSYNMNNSNGIINFKVPVTLSKGIHQITIISGDNGKYLASRANTLLIRV